MALQRLRLDWQITPGADYQTMTQTWGVDGPVLDAGVLASTLVNSAPQFRTYVHGLWRMVLFSVYDAAGGPALSAATMSTPGAIQSNYGQLPPQTAVAVNSMISTNVGDRPKGRTFFGGFAGSTALSNTADGRPSDTGLNHILLGCVNWHEALVGLGLTPVVLAGDGLSVRGPIVAYQTDNSWDTMRTRKYERTKSFAMAP